MQRGGLAIANIHLTFSFALILLAVELVANIVAEFVGFVVDPACNVDIDFAIVALAKSRMSGAVLVSQVSKT